MHVVVVVVKKTNMLATIIIYTTFQSGKIFFQVVLTKPQLLALTDLKNKQFFTKVNKKAQGQTGLRFVSLAYLCSKNDDDLVRSILHFDLVAKPSLLLVCALVLLT